MPTNAELSYRLDRKSVEAAILRMLVASKENESVKAKARKVKSIDGAPKSCRFGEKGNQKRQNPCNVFGEERKVVSLSRRVFSLYISSSQKESTAKRLTPPKNHQSYS